MIEINERLVCIEELINLIEEINRFEEGHYESDITLEQMIKKVANYFLEEMKDNDFETFDEMKECYWWTTKDIKDTVDYLLREDGWFIDAIDGSDIFDNYGNIVSSYRSFIAKVYKIIK